ncbi:DNRLRE domain-containing protein [Priestia aryabhattai]|uniref:DNRLRE domain-containing protein n=1 Tax=Priestia aryabhattai TaxID=412384 RepID=UPI003CB94188
MTKKGFLNVADGFPTSSRDINDTESTVITDVEIKRNPILTRLSAFNQIAGGGNVTEVPLNGGVNGTVTSKHYLTADTVLLSASAGNNYGAFASLPIRGGAVNKQRALIRADFTGVNADKITAAKLKMYDLNAGVIGGATQSAEGTINVHPVTAANADWVQGTTNGAAAANGEPTWNKKASSTVDWAGGVGLGSPGSGGYLTNPITALNRTIGYTGYVEGSLDITVLKTLLEVKGGFLLKAADETVDNNGISLSSKEGSLDKIGYFEITQTLPSTVRPAFIAFETTGIGARVLDGNDSNGPGVPIPVNGLVLPAKSLTGSYKIYAPTGINVTWFVMGYE